MQDDAAHVPEYPLRQLVDQLPSMLAYWDSSLRCRYANQAYRRWFGVDPQQLLGATLQELLGPELFALNEPYIRGALRGEAQLFERVLPGPDGVARHSLAHFQPDVVDGQVRGFVASVTEVTPIKRTEMRLRNVIETLEAEMLRRRTAEQSLQDLQQALAVTLATIDAGFIATDRAGRVTRMNEVSEWLTGWPQAQALGRPLFEVFVREDRPAEFLAQNPVDLMLQQGLTVEHAHVVVALARDGRRTPVEARAAPTRDSDGGVRGMALVLRDLTRQQQADIEANRLAAIVESSQDAIIGKTLEGRITNWNSAAQALFGYSAEEAVGRPVQMLIPTDRLDEEMRILASLARGVRVPAFESLRRAKDGTLREVSITISPIRDSLGRVAGAATILRDVSQRNQAEQARRRAEALEAENRKIQEANRLKSQFLANMSHELRTPLNAIIGFADLLHADRVPHESPKFHTYLGHIAQSGRHLLQLINDVLDLAKVESGKFEFFPEPVDLPRLVQEVGDILRTGLERKKLVFGIAVDPQLQGLVLDPVRLKQVLYNYLSNAIKFTPEGGRVEVQARPEGAARFRIEVHDNGVGIRAVDIPTLFSEFQQLDAGHSRAHAGTGLGLALTRRLVEAQGGSVGVRSQLGQGSVFHAVLPRVHGGGVEPGQATAPAAEPAAEPSTAPTAALRLLVIEPDPQVQARMVSELAAAGFGVFGANSAAQAAQLAGSRGFDALTLDLQLPDQPGLNLLARLRAEAPGPVAPVLGMTVPARAGQAAGFAIADILSKPISGDEVVAAMARVRRGSGTMRAMVVDDDPHAQELMRQALAAAGIEAVCFGDGREALRAIDEVGPQAIVLDLMMPGFDGFEMLAALHQLPAWRETPVFVWTSMLLSDEEYAQLALSAQAVLSKGGGDLAAMLERLRRWRPLLHQT